MQKKEGKFQHVIVKQPVFFYCGDRLLTLEKTKILTQTSSLELNETIYQKYVHLFGHNQLWNFHKTHTKKKKEKCQLTTWLGSINSQVVKELNPTTGYPKGTCFLFISNRFNMREKNKT